MIIIYCNHSTLNHALSAQTSYHINAYPKRKQGLKWYWSFLDHWKWKGDVDKRPPEWSKGCSKIDIKLETRRYFLIKSLLNDDELNWDPITYETCKKHIQQFEFKKLEAFPKQIKQKIGSGGLISKPLPLYSKTKIKHHQS